MPDSIRVSRAVLEQMEREARAHPSEECCGLLAGTASDAAGATAEACITAIYPASNASPRPATSYEIAPAELFPIIRRIRAARLALLGIYHSHPASENYPSPRDLALAYHPDAAYFIVSLRPGPANKTVRAFRLGSGPVCDPSDLIRELNIRPA